jgi:hypothetical protein
MYITRRLIILAVVLVLLVMSALLLLIQPGGSGVLASLRLPDGSECMVTQRCNWSPEPYTVAQRALVDHDLREHLLQAAHSTAAVIALLHRGCGFTHDTEITYSHGDQDET